MGFYDNMKRRILGMFADFIVAELIVTIVWVAAYNLDGIFIMTHLADAIGIYKETIG